MAGDPSQWGLSAGDPSQWGRSAQQALNFTKIECKTSALKAPPFSALKAPPFGA
ncbi:MAG TPA: hypothetical protein VIL85_22440 [Thermomicrobiales bacterium]